MNDTDTLAIRGRTSWNKGKLIGQEPPLKLKAVWALRTRLPVAGKTH